VEVSADPQLKFATGIRDDGVESRALHGLLGRVDSSVWIVGSAFAAFIAKLLIALNTFGSNDVAALYIFARSLHDHGLEWTYRNGVPWGSSIPLFNHPPLTAYYLELIDVLSRNEFFRACGLTFPLLLRLPGIIADFVAVLIVLRIYNTNAEVRLPMWALLLFALSPVSLMVSGFHGNTDPVMVMFLLAAVYMCLRERPLWCGIFFALSCQVKIIPLFLLPLLFFFWLSRQARLRFLLAWLFLTIALWTQPLMMFPRLFVGNVLAYGSQWGWWGITYWLRLTHFSQFDVVGFVNLPAAASFVATFLKVIIAGSVLVIGWRRRYLGAAGLVSSVAYAWLVFFVFSPGFCAYYLMWLAPFVLLLSPALYGWLTAASSLFLFVFYNTLAGGLPWYIAVAKFSDPNRFNLLAPWALWAWAIMICGLIICWRKAAAADSSLRLFSLKTLPAKGV
jgi:ALG6, ALG8 glycosyltransferase family